MLDRRPAIPPRLPTDESVDARWRTLRNSVGTPIVLPCPPLRPKRSALRAPQGFAPADTPTDNSKSRKGTFLMG